MCQAPWQGLWVQKVADKRPALEEATGKDEAAVMTSRRGVRVPARSHGLQERRGVAEYVGGGWEAFSEEAALQKSFHPGRERALHRGSDTQKAQTGSPGRAEGPAGGRASPASGAEGGADVAGTGSGIAGVRGADTGTPKFRAALLTRTPTSLHLKYPRKEKNG